MARRSKEKAQKDVGPQTQARKSFDANVGPMSALIKKIHPNEVTRATKSVERAVQKFVETKEKKYIRSLTRATASFSEATDQWLGLRKFSFESMSVMLVVFLEAYLEDGLVELAIRVPTLMKDMPAPEASRVFEVETLDELRDELRRQWAQLKVHGGPDKWEKMLVGMGARGYVKEEIYALQHLWEILSFILGQL
jgi:hypothetical protein